MPYFKPYIDEAGIHIPTYNEIKEFLINKARAIYGNDIYLENDGQDYEFITLMADCIHDCNLTSQLVYNNRGPKTAIGAALGGLVKLNGIRFKSATASTAVVTITAEPRTKIINGMIADDLGNNWTLPTPMLIPDGPGVLSIEALATCMITGRLTAPPDTLTNIVTPTDGWIAVTNLEAATPGQEVEGQEELRARQTISTARPSRTVLEGLIGGIAEIPDVTRYRIYENDTNVFGFYGPPIPGHSISAVVEGGIDDVIGQEIYLRKTPGCGSYGDITVEIHSGVVLGLPLITPINFFRPIYYDTHVTVTVKRLTGYTTATNDNIKSNVTAYLNSLAIGDSLTISALWGAALSAMPNIHRPSFSITALFAGKDQKNQSPEDMEVPFNAVTRGVIENIEVLYA
jgi:uncharacterized phage protein gp47/JayE